MFMADFEDSLSPNWANILGGHYNMMKAVRKTIRFYDSEKAKEYFIKEIKSQVFIRPRSLGREEENVSIDGSAVGAAFFDVVVYVFHN